jgi:NADH:ubiquinone oxidoreductase subunit 6 (subunit J)
MQSIASMQETLRYFTWMEPTDRLLEHLVPWVASITAVGGTFLLFPSTYAPEVPIFVLVAYVIAALQLLQYCQQSGPSILPSQRTMLTSLSVALIIGFLVAALLLTMQGPATDAQQIASVHNPNPSLARTWMAHHTFRNLLAGICIVLFPAVILLGHLVFAPDIGATSVLALLFFAIMGMVLVVFGGGVRKDTQPSHWVPAALLLGLLVFVVFRLLVGYRQPIASNDIRTQLGSYAVLDIMWSIGKSTTRTLILGVLVPAVLFLVGMSLVAPPAIEKERETSKLKREKAGRILMGISIVLLFTVVLSWMWHNGEYV